MRENSLIGIASEANAFTSASGSHVAPVSIDDIKRAIDELGSVGPTMPFGGYPIRIIPNQYLPAGWKQIECDGLEWKGYVHVDDAGQVRRAISADQFRYWMGNPKLMVKP